MLKTIFIVFALILSSVAHAGDYWKTMPKLEYAFFAAETADMLTTLDIKNHPDLYEQNPIMGRHPSDAKVIGWCVSAALMHSAITHEMVVHGVRPSFINAWEYVSIGVETGFAVHNLSVGLRFTF